MQCTEQPKVLSELISAGVDWITATAQTPPNVHAADDLATGHFERTLDRGGVVKEESRLGYVGYSTDGFFHGHSARGRMTIASGGTADDLWSSISNTADHISRLDLQATVWTHGEQPHLGVQAYRCLRANPPARVHVRNVTLISNHPKGETCNVGKRISGQYGRIYDYATAHDLGTERTVWRYEVEHKNDFARRISAHLHRATSRAGEVASLVRRWFLDRGIMPIFESDEAFSHLKLPQSSHERDTLSWFRATLSKTVARQIALHGREAVIEALGLANGILPN